MGIFLRRHRGLYSLSGIAKLGIVMFVISLAYAMVDTIWAVYLQSIFHNVSIISFVSAFITFIAFISFFILIPIVERNNKSKLFKISLFFIGISYLIFFISRSMAIFFVAAILWAFFTSLRINAFGIIIRDKSSNKKLSRNEGLIYTFFNLAWLIGPLIAGFVSDKYGVPIIFPLAAAFIFLGLFMFKISKINDSNITKKVHGNVFKNFISFFKSKDRTKAYILGGGVNSWLILIYLYTPLMIINSHLGDIWIGYFLASFVIMPILFEYYFSKIAGKVGFKRMFQTGFLILGLAALVCFFISNIYIIMGILAISSIGIAMIEPTTEAYFFDILKKKKEESLYYGPYNTTIEVSYFIGSFICGLLLLFIPFKSIFLVFSAFMAIYFIVSFSMKDVKEDGKR